jgi:hypothetical protein
MVRRGRLTVTAIWQTTLVTTSPMGADNMDLIFM